MEENKSEQMLTSSGEQPEQNNSTLKVEKQLNYENLTGSPLPKFKSAKELGKAYENLEKEFTQKCQKVKELTEKIDTRENTASVPEYQKNGWEEKVEKFFSSHPEAKEYVNEISEVLQSDEKIANGDDSLDGALTKVLAQKFMPYDKLVNDKDFLEKYIYSNDEISKNIVEKYLDKLEQKKAMPLMASSNGSGTFTSPVEKPKTIEDAGKMAE